MAPFEYLYGRMCKSPIGWFEVDEFSLVGIELVICLWIKFKLL